MTEERSADYKYPHGSLSLAHAYLLPVLKEVVKKYSTVGSRILDLGCGNGSVAGALFQDGREVFGVDSSLEGIRLAEQQWPEIRFVQGSVYDVNHFDQNLYETIISIEVIEHLYSPRRFMSAVTSQLSDDGVLILTTPYHGYLKNLALALLGKMDWHYTALWEGGHIKFWSLKTLNQLLRENGFRILEVFYCGRFRPFSKSFMIVAKRA